MKDYRDKRRSVPSVTYLFRVASRVFDTVGTRDVQKNLNRENFRESA